MKFPSPLYAITDGHRDEDPLPQVREWIAAGVRVVQLRWKDAPVARMLPVALEMRRLTARAHGLFIVNDRIDVALAAKADAVHLGQEDLPLAAARRVARGRLAIGVSTHDVDQAQAAVAGGADYIGFGPIFATATKNIPGQPKGIEMLRRVRSAVAVPIVAIGGITDEKAESVLAAGADAVAMISALSRAKDPAATIRRILDRAPQVGGGGGTSP